ncbi:MAG: hypothetical protein KC996_05370 [Phycisphaerales bacterium]|nr:hypothetical protein [Phycisphaerales bacterium]
MNTKHTLLRAARLSLACGLLSCAGLASPVMADLQLNSEGWTVIQPSADTQFIFVSSSEGLDSNSGRSPNKPVRTLAQAKQLMRDQSADWMLLKRGDVWDEPFGSWNFSGRSEDEPVVITTYGDAAERPVIRAGDAHAIQTGFGREVNNVALVGLRFEADMQDNGSKIGIRWLSSGSGLLVEDCFIRGFKDNIIIQGTGTFHNAVIRRSVIVDSYSTSGHSQGIFAKDVTGILLEENVFDSNGENLNIAGAVGDGFNQNVYLQVGVLDAVFRGNIASNGPAAGAQLRSGGVAENNLFFQNSLGLRFGYSELAWPEEYASGRVEGNVVLGGDLTGTEQQGIGLWIERFKDTVVQRNVVANSGDGNENVAINLSGYGEAFILQGNVTHNWTNGSTGHSLKSFIRPGDGSVIMSNCWSMQDSPKIVTVKYTENIQFLGNETYSTTNTSGQFSVGSSVMSFDQWANQPFTEGEEHGAITLPDAGRDLDDYAHSLGLADADAFIEHARNMSRGNWDSRFTGAAAARYIRAGYLTGSFADAVPQDDLN